MSSEADPSSLERGPPSPPPAAAASSDKRPRGRPRKDGAAPVQRTRKKPRSRGKTAVEDEDSMDGLETADTENTVAETVANIVANIVATIVETDVKEKCEKEDTLTDTDSSNQQLTLVHFSVPEMAAVSAASVDVGTQTSERLCAFCYCAERSFLGQGELKQFSPTPGFISQWKNRSNKKLNSIDEKCDRISTEDILQRQRCQRIPKSSQQSTVSCTSISSQTSPEETTSKFWDELSQVGLPDDVDVQALFEPTGHCWAHHRCAEWSQEVCRTQDQGLGNVDKAVVSGITKRCAYCKHLGATIRCCGEKCEQTYHYPCAAGAGTFQDFSHFSLLCPEHINQAPERSKEEANCAVCDSFGDLSDQLFCTTCGQHYHGMCLDVAVTPLKRAGWQCPDCKVCQNCKHSGEDNMMLVCDTCDKGYHTFCLQPIMDSVPTNGWKCKNCRICSVCCIRTSCQWHHNCLVCDSCYQLHENLPCPFCEKPYHPDLQKNMLHCQMCKRWIHIECIKCTESETDSPNNEDYICTVCKRHDVIREETCPERISDMVPESDSVCPGKIEVEQSENERFQEQALIDRVLCQEHSVRKPLYEPAQICDSGERGTMDSQVDAHEMGNCQSGYVFKLQDMDPARAVSESVDPLTEQTRNQLLEKQFPEQDVVIVDQSLANACTLPMSLAASVSPPEKLRPTNEYDLSHKVKEQYALDGTHEDMLEKNDLNTSETSEVLMEMETTPASESFTELSSPIGDKTGKSPSDIDSPFTSFDTSKTSVSSSPAVSLDMHCTHDMFQSQTPPTFSFLNNNLPTTHISITPKIGMGKPAITKRKFSPGRPRSRQGTWSMNNTVSPPSWSPDGLEGRDIFKTRQLLSNAIWSIKVGRGSGFPGKRRPRGSALSGRGGRGRSKLKNGLGPVIFPGVATFDMSLIKDEEDNAMHNTVVLFSSSDKFTLHQDMCVVCGSFGQGAEGRLLACSQCGQCYHPFCVNIKLTRVIIKKGWRCLECTVCEACGKATDPGRLLLCDDCDISYHTYCLDPPLQTVPKGGWKCKWCVWCTNCRALTPGIRCEWQNNYTQCAPCASLSTCPICCCNYREQEIILQCRQCDRWVHGSCQNLHTEEEVENAADGGFDCSMCRPYVTPTHVPSSDGCESPIVAQIITKAKEPEPPKTFTQDGVCLTESGLTHLQSLTATVTRKKRSKPKLKLKIINQNSVAVLQTPPELQSEHSRDGEMEDSREAELMDCDVKSDSSPERECAHDETKGIEVDIVKKKKRKPYRPGIGGFMVRQRSRTGQGKAKRSLSRKDSSGSVSEQRLGLDDGWSELLPDAPIDESDSTEKIKKRYRKKKNKLEETFPNYLQEAFFGKNLLATSRQKKKRLNNSSECPPPVLGKTNFSMKVLDISSDTRLGSVSSLVPLKHRLQGSTLDRLSDLSDVLNTDDDLLGVFSDDLVKTGRRSAGLDMEPISDSSALPQPSINRISRHLSEEQLDGILSPELDKMVTDGAILGKLFKIPELEGKDVEDLFTAVLSPINSQPPPLTQLPPHPQLMPLHCHGGGVYSRIPLMNGLIVPRPHLSNGSLTCGPALGTFTPIAQLPYSETRDKNPIFNTLMNDPSNSWNPSAQATEGEGDTMSNAQRSTLKWEKEEALGEMATVAPVLYTNMNFSNLKEEFPDWSTRVKQIAKLWRKASSQERAPYVQKARENRTALRINKVQLSNDSMKRQQQQEIVDPNSRVDSDLFKDPLRQRESEHEQEWKFRQRQMLRERLLIQQQNKNAGRQDKGMQDAATSPPAGPASNWQQDDLNHQNELFSRPPPPYPGIIRTAMPQSSERFPMHSKDHRGPFPGNSQFGRPPFTGDISAMGMRPHAQRFTFSGGNYHLTPGQERFFGPPLQMQAPCVPQQIRSLPFNMPRPLNLQMSSVIGLTSHYPPHGMPVQQHNISGQAYIELRHRPPDGRPRLIFAPPGTNVIEAATQHHRQTGFFPEQDFPGPRLMESMRNNQPGLPGTIRIPMHFDHLSESQQNRMPLNHPHTLALHSGDHEQVDSFSSVSLSGTSPTKVSGEMQLSKRTTEGLPDKRDTDNSTGKDLDVKDLEGVEVKDLDDEDLENLNLDPDDGKGDELDTLDNIEANDPNLDDLLRSEEFDIIAYTAGELDLGDKKGMFSEELDLNVPIDDKCDLLCKSNVAKNSEKKSRLANSPVVPLLNKTDATEVKTEIITPNSQEERTPENVEPGSSQSCHSPSTGSGLSPITAATESCSQGVSNENNPESSALCRNVIQGHPPLSSQGVIVTCSVTRPTPVRGLVASEKSENSETFCLSSPPQSPTPAQSNQSLGTPHTIMTPPRQMMEHAASSNLTMVARLKHTFKGPTVNTGGIPMQPTGHTFGTMEPENQIASVGNQPGPSALSGPQQLMLQQNRERPLLLEEQPLLLQDLLDQERQEQQQQRQMQAMIRQRSEPFFPNVDFDAITDPIMKAKMVALKGINKVMAQNNMGIPPIVMNRFPFINQQMPGSQSTEGPKLVQHGIRQDGSIQPQMARPNPPNFGPGFVNDSQKKQYEEWLQETQQLLQMQQKFLEEQIGAHRKSKKALSAKQRTAKKAGRELPEEDAEQLKHVIEQQTMVQKQLEQIRKQQKEHAELIEEYRIKQQQCTVAAHASVTAVETPPPAATESTPTLINQQNFSMVQQHSVINPGQPNPLIMPGMTGWQSSNAPRTLIPVNVPMILQPAAHMPKNPESPQSASVPVANAQSNAPPRVEFDDNNPFSESFQERERKERLREQQERQRIQLMQEVDRQRALQQRLEMEQHGMMGSDLHDRHLNQMPFFTSELHSDFIQPSIAVQLSPQPHQQIIQGLPHQSIQPALINSPPTRVYMQSNETRQAGHSPCRHDQSSVPGESSHCSPLKQSQSSDSGTNVLVSRLPFLPGIPITPPGNGSELSYGQDATISNASNYSGTNQALTQLYSDIIPEEKGKKKRRKKKKEHDIDSAKTCSTPHSDFTAPPTPSISDTSSAPTISVRNEPDHHEKEHESRAQPGSSTPNCLVPQSSLELQSHSRYNDVHQCVMQQKADMTSETVMLPTDEPRKICNIKLEFTDSDHSPLHIELKEENLNDVKTEEKTPPSFSSLTQSLEHTTDGRVTKAESGNELLKHLLKNKKLVAVSHNKAEDCMQSKEQCLTDKKYIVTKHPLEVMQIADDPFNGGTGTEPSQKKKKKMEPDKKKTRNKRVQKTGESALPRAKKRKKDEERKSSICPKTETFEKFKKQLSLLPLMEPILAVNFANFLPYGSNQLNGGSHLLGTFGNATMDGVSDYYSQLIYKVPNFEYHSSPVQDLRTFSYTAQVPQNNLSNPPTPPASLPPTPPPVSCQKMVNGFATADELAGKARMLSGRDVTRALGHKQFHLPFRPQDDFIARAIVHCPKTVDVPASLPTPPHNYHEDLRTLDHCEGRGTPESFVPSSSPESVVGMELAIYPDLSLVKKEPPHPATSPVIPMLPSSTGKGSEVWRNYVKTEAPSKTLFFGSQFLQAPNCPKSGLISVAITLHPTAVENINGIVSAIADILHVRIPNSYEVSGTPETSPVGLMNNKRNNVGLEYRKHLLLHGNRAGSVASARTLGPYGLKQPNMQFTPGNNAIPGLKDHNQHIANNTARKHQWCRHCKVVVLGSGVRKLLSDLPLLKQEHHVGLGGVENEDIVFCSNNCFLLHSTVSQAKHLESKEMSSLTQPALNETPPKAAFHQYSTNISTLDVHCLPRLHEKVSPSASPPINFPPAGFETAKVEAKPDELKVTVKLKPRMKAVHCSFDDSRPPSKKWKGMKWKRWNIQIVIPKGIFKTQCEGEIEELIKELGTSMRRDPLPKDYRKCCFCHTEGDGQTNGPARLLNLDLDVWVHLNCALWSTEVYETQAGALINVELALRRGLQMKCVFCHKMGATSGCHRFKCTNIYHFTCANKAQCMFFKDKTMLCPTHKPKGAHEQELNYFAVFRRVYVQRDEVRQIASIVQRGERDHTFRVGSLIFHTIGQLLPQQMQAFHSSTALFPVGYEASRLYWSMRYANKRCRYLCSIEEKDGVPWFVIRVVEHGHEDLVLSDTTPKGAWDKILEPVACCRKGTEILRLFPIYLKGEDLFGLTVSAVVRIAESLPGVEECENYTFRYGRNALMEIPLAINPTGCTRSEPKTSSHVKRFVLRPHTLNSTSTSKSFQSTVTGELNAPYSKQFVHSKSSQYRKMKTEWKSNVYLARSHIQGLGLYAARDIEKHTMVIEYIGTIIRNEVANRKEKLYESQNRGVYMFRMDNEHVIDATLTGGPARYINHSCAPNCVAEVVTFEKGHKIIISSNRRIQKGEELCYDYKFDFEDDQHKIPCHCGAVNCRKWMN
ncbi:histone-lysine N-methyltransferase 2C isoform X7 [Ambystoma mexicanum]|uniref:histone-lysine N-methyltransferase 2C isoform X7 n=1 Tax=Ambystoma mexicanum TaxID=8296 RepID=UPI0037E8C053